MHAPTKDEPLSTNDAAWWPVEAPATAPSAQTAPPRKSRFGLLLWILCAIILGIAFGLILPVPIARVFTTFNGLFAGFLDFIVPLVIIGFVTPAIGELGRGAGKMLGLTAGVAYLSTILAGLGSLAVALLVLPTMLRGKTIGTLEDPSQSALAPFFTIEIEPVVGVMTALILSFMLGIGLTLVPEGALHNGFNQLRTIVERTISVILIPLLPLYIFGMFLGLTMNGQIWNVIISLLGVVVLVFAMTIVILLVQYTLAGALNHRNPITMLVRMMPAYATALGTSSSAATIPVTLDCTRRNGVPDAIASFAVPLCATIHLSGSTAKITTFALAVMLLTGMDVSVPALIGFVLLLGITMVAAPGVPGGAIMAAVGVLTSVLGFNQAAVGLMIAAYIAIDSFGTATNVTGDGALAAIVSRIAPRSMIERLENESRRAVAQGAA